MVLLLRFLLHQVLLIVRFNNIENKGDMMIAIFTIVFFMIDRVTKIFALKIESSIDIIPNFFRLTLAKNTWIAWSLFSNDTVIITIVTMIIIFFFIKYILDNKNGNKLYNVCYAMILGGAFGNLFDRVFFGYVIDFLDFNIFGYDYPIFNLADTFIVCGIIIILVGGIRDECNKRNR